IGKGGQIARSAGTYAQIVGRDGQYVILRLNSAEQRMVHGRCMATIGAVSNPDNMNVSIGKAGRKRWMGRMPHNRGVSMNPIDHPHGGGGGGRGAGGGGGGRGGGGGFPPPGKKSPAATNPPPNSSLRAATRGRSRRGRHHGAFDLERSVRRRLSAQESGGVALVRPSRD